jgi:hypothetical protein
MHDKNIDEIGGNIKLCLEIMFKKLTDKHQTS